MSAYPPENEYPPTTPLFEETRGYTDVEIDPIGSEAPARTGTFDNANFDNAGDASGGASAQDAAEQAKNVASDAKDAGQHVVGVTKDQAKQVASEAKGQARQLLGQATSELRDQAVTQQQRVAAGLHDVSDEFAAMAGDSAGGVASELVRSLGSRSDSVASWLENRDPGSLLSEVRSYAARKPGTFIAIAAAAGIVAGRLAKSLATSAAEEKAADVDGASGVGL